MFKLRPVHVHPHHYHNLFMNSGEFHAAVSRLLAEEYLAMNSGMAKLNEYGSDGDDEGDDDEDEVENARRLSMAGSGMSNLGFHNASQPPHLACDEDEDEDEDEFTGIDFPQQKDTFNLDEDEEDDDEYEESEERAANASKEDTEVAKLELAKIARLEEAKAAKLKAARDAKIKAARIAEADAEAARIAEEEAEVARIAEEAVAARIAEVEAARVAEAEAEAVKANAATARAAKARTAKMEKLRAAHLAAAKAAGMNLTSEDMQDAPMVDVPRGNEQDTRENGWENESTPLDLAINELHRALFRLDLELLLTLGPEFIEVLSNLNSEEDGVCKYLNGYLRSHFKFLYQTDKTVSAKARCNPCH